MSAQAATAQARADMLAGLETEVRELQRLRSHRRVLEMAPFVLLAAWGASVVGSEAWVARVSGTVAIALAMNAGVLFLHEGMHATLFAHRGVNRWVSVVLGGTVCMSFTAYQVLHLRHHQFLGDQRDPDDYDNYVRSRALVWTLHFVRLVAGGFLYLVLIPVFAFRYGGWSERRRMGLEYLLVALGWLLLSRVAGADALVRAWLVPMVLVNWMTNVRGFSQHGITEASDPYIASRSIHPHPVVAALVIHENLHLEHHLFPEVPSYNLSALHRLLAPRLPRVVVSSSYTGFLARFLRQSLTLDRSPIGLEIRS